MAKRSTAQGKLAIDAGAACTTRVVYEDADAVFDDGGRRRPLLWRIWDRSLPAVGWIGCNPSVAGAQDDPSVRRMVGFSARDGFGALWLANLDDCVSTDPRGVQLGTLAHAEWQWRGFGERVQVIVVAWGAVVKAAGLSDRAAACRLWAMRWAGGHPDRRVMCLGRTASGHFKHPLYLRGDTPLVPCVYGSRGIG